MFGHGNLYDDSLLNLVISVYHHVSIVLSLLVNCTLITLIIKSRRKDFGAYRYLLLTFATVDIYYALVHYVVMPIPESWGSAFAMTGHGYLTGKFGVCWFAGVHSHSFVVLVFHFLYRLLAVKRSQYIELFTRPWFSVLYYFFDADEFVIDYVRTMLRDNALATALPVEDYSTAVFWTNGTFSGPRWSPIFGVLVMAQTMSAGYGFMIYSATKINWHMMKDSGVVSKRTASLQRQLLKALMYQMLLPLLTAYSPPLISVVTPFLGITMRLMSYATPILCGLHPWLDGCVLIWTIKEYRMILYRFFTRKKIADTDHTASTVKQGNSISGNSSHF